GQHRQAGGTTLLVTARNLGGHKVFANHALGRRGFLDLGNNGGLAGSDALAQRGNKATRWRLLARARLHVGKRRTLLALGDFLLLAQQDAIQHGAGVLHTHDWPCSACCSASLRLSSAVKSLSSIMRSRASPLCTRSSAMRTPSASVRATPAT